MTDECYLKIDVRLMRTVLLALLACGCGPIQSSTKIVDAAAALAAAKTAGADKHAPFEYTAAEEYLHKAREEQSYSDFEVSINYAEKSTACASVARMKAEDMTRKEMGSSRRGSLTKLRCRPGPERNFKLVDADQEPGAAPTKPQPKGKPVPMTPPPKRENEPAEEPAEPNEPNKNNEPNEPNKNNEPKDPEPELPEGDKPAEKGS